VRENLNASSDPASTVPCRSMAKLRRKLKIWPLLYAAAILFICLRYISVYEFNNLIWNIPSSGHVKSVNGVFEVSDKYRISDMYDLNVDGGNHLYFRCYPIGRVVDCLDRGRPEGRARYNGKFATVSYFDYANWLTGRERIILSVLVDGKFVLTQNERLREIRNERMENRPNRGLFSVLNWVLIAFSIGWSVIFLRWSFDITKIEE